MSSKRNFYQQFPIYNNDRSKIKKEELNEEFISDMLDKMLCDLIKPTVMPENLLDYMYMNPIKANLSVYSLKEFNNGSNCPIIVIPFIFFIKVIGIKKKQRDDLTIS